MSLPPSYHTSASRSIYSRLRRPITKRICTHSSMTHLHPFKNLLDDLLLAWSVGRSCNSNGGFGANTARNSEKRVVGAPVEMRFLIPGEIVVWRPFRTLFTSLVSTLRLLTSTRGISSDCEHPQYTVTRSTKPVCIISRHHYLRNAPDQL